MTRPPRQMRARASEFLDRPVPERARPLAIVGALVILALIAIAITALDDRGQPTATQSQTAPTPPSAVAPIAPTTAPQGPPSAVLDAARGAARRFARYYLRYSYGRLRPQHIAVASDDLKLYLEANPVRVPPAVRRRHPTVTELTTDDDATSQRVGFSVTVVDGDLSYVLHVRLEAGTHGWEAVAVS